MYVCMYVCIVIQSSSQVPKWTWFFIFPSSRAVAVSHPCRQAALDSKQREVHHNISKRKGAFGRRSSEATVLEATVLHDGAI